MPEHGVIISEQATSVSTPAVAESGIPFFIGAAPIQSAESPATLVDPVLCTSWDEALEKLGYSEDWSKYQLCEAMYSHFMLFQCQPAIFVNLLDPATMKSAVGATDKAVTNHKVELPIEAMDTAALVVKAAGGAGAAYVKDTDYIVYYLGEKLIVELLSTGGHYAEASLNIAYDAVTPASVNVAAVAAGMENIEKCLTTIGVVPDIIAAPGFSDNTSVAAVMATKAAGINGMFKAKALIDISSASAGGADKYDEVVALKGTNNFTDANEILCWPLLKLGARTFHMATQLAGLMAQVDTKAGGVPYESPSNKGFKCDSMVNAAGTEIKLTLAQANTLNAGGIVTAINFLNGWVAWGNYTACYPGNTDPKDYYIPISRMFDWVGNTEIRTFWAKLDKPQNRRLIDSIMDANNIWLNGLTGQGYFHGARAEFIEGENPLADLLAGKIKIHNYLAPPGPLQELDFVLEYDASYVTAALQG